MKSDHAGRLRALEDADIVRRVAALFREGVLAQDDNGRIVARDSEARNVAAALDALARRGLLRVAGA